MGMFDDIKCKYLLPLPQYQDLGFQTKDTEAQYCDNYEIREDGTLWHETYDTEDRSEVGKWMREHPGEKVKETFTLLQYAGCSSRTNKKWEQVQDFTAEIRFYTSLGEKRTGWVEFSAYFVKGKLNQLHVLQHEPVQF